MINTSARIYLSVCFSSFFLENLKISQENQSNLEKKKKKRLTDKQTGTLNVSICLMSREAIESLELLSGNNYI